MLSQLHGLNERWNQAWLEKDAANVERLMADDYIYVAPNGLILNRQAILGTVRAQFPRRLVPLRGILSRPIQCGPSWSACRPPASPALLCSGLS